MTPFERLAESVGIDPGDLPALGAADATALEHVADTVERLLEAEDSAVDSGMREAVAIVPRPLRGVARGLLFGDA